jgi:hypothetical protein
MNRQLRHTRQNVALSAELSTTAGKGWNELVNALAVEASGYCAGVKEPERDGTITGSPASTV